MKKLALIIAVLTVASLVLCSCGAESKIIGTWAASESILGISVPSTLTFKEDGTGTQSMSGVDLATTYEFKDGKLCISTSLLGISDTTEYDYGIKGDTLTLTAGGKTTVYTKQK